MNLQWSSHNVVMNKFYDHRKCQFQHLRCELSAKNVDNWLTVVRRGVRREIRGLLILAQHNHDEMEL